LELWRKAVNKFDYRANLVVSGFPLTGLLHVQRPARGISAYDPDAIV
jgi:hypothetical protein